MKSFDQQVRERAYHIWEGEGRVFGRADEHWLRAEAEFSPARDSGSEIVATAAAIRPAAEVPSPAKALKTRAAKPASAAARAVAAKAEDGAKAGAKSKTVKAEAETKIAAKDKTVAAKATKVAKTASAKRTAPRASAATSAALH